MIHSYLLESPGVALFGRPYLLFEVNQLNPQIHYDKPSLRLSVLSLCRLQRAVLLALRPSTLGALTIELTAWSPHFLPTVLRHSIGDHSLRLCNDQSLIATTTILVLPCH